jgi:hypothetical protein
MAQWLLNQLQQSMHDAKMCEWKLMASWHRVMVHVWPCDWLLLPLLLLLLLQPLSLAEKLTVPKADGEATQQPASKQV